MQITMIRLAQLGSTLGLALGPGPQLLAQINRDPPPVVQPPSAGRAGPAWVKAAAAAPMRLDLQWAPVVGGRWYQLFRSSILDGGEKLLEEIPDVTADQDVAKGYYFHFDYLPERSGLVTFSYRVVAVFVGLDGSRVNSLSSPVASVVALQPAIPPNLRYRVGMSKLMGRLRLTFDWGAVPNATGYHIFQVPIAGTSPLPFTEGIIKETTLTVDGVMPGQGSTFCVVAAYEGFLKDDTRRAFVLVNTKPR